MVQMQDRVQIDTRLVQMLYGGIRSTLYNRKLFRQLKDGERWEVGFVGYMPLPHLDAVTFVVDTKRLPVAVEKLDDPRVAHQISTALGGRRVVATNTRGLAFTVSIWPPEPHGRLPRSVSLDLEKRPAGQYMVPIGEGRNGPLWRSLLETGHILVGGTSGYGKSTWLNAMLAALLAAHGPDELKLVLIDPKMVEFTDYYGLPHLLSDVATGARQAAGLLGELLLEVSRRAQLFAPVQGARDLKAYNERVPDAPLPLIVAVVDEVTDVVAEAGDENLPVVPHLKRLVSKARAMGVVMVLSTQNPKADVLDTHIRSNCATRIAFRAETHDHSKTILGVRGAEALPGKIRGRILARLTGGKPVVVQGYRVSDEVIAEIVSRWRGDAPAERPSPLGEAERELVRVAVEQLDGCFIIGRVGSAGE
jgi:hypothetical protein